MTSLGNMTFRKLRLATPRNQLIEGIEIELRFIQLMHYTMIGGTLVSDCQRRRTNRYTAKDAHKQ